MLRGGNRKRKRRRSPKMLGDPEAFQEAARLKARRDLNCDFYAAIPTATG
jgi:hypothetical protein